MSFTSLKCVLSSSFHTAPNMFSQNIKYGNSQSGASDSFPATQKSWKKNVEMAALTKEGTFITHKKL